MIDAKTHIMIDIETFGTKPTAPILSIAAVVFSIENGFQSKEFLVNVDIDNCLDYGCKLELNTIKWWFSKPPEELEQVCNHEGILLKPALLKLSDFVNDPDIEDVCVWGNSARFDFGILESAFDRTNLPLPWKHQNERDVRTIVAFNPDIKASTTFKGTRHNPLHDCKHQIEYLTATMEYIRSNKSFT